MYLQEEDQDHQVPSSSYSSYGLDTSTWDPPGCQKRKGKEGNKVKKRLVFIIQFKQSSSCLKRRVCKHEIESHTTRCHCKTQWAPDTTTALDFSDDVCDYTVIVWWPGSMSARIGSSSRLDQSFVLICLKTLVTALRHFLDIIGKMANVAPKSVEL